MKCNAEEVIYDINTEGWVRQDFDVREPKDPDVFKGVLASEAIGMLNSSRKYEKAVIKDINKHIEKEIEGFIANSASPLTGRELDLYKDNRYDELYTEARLEELIHNKANARLRSIPAKYVNANGYVYQRNDSTINVVHIEETISGYTVIHRTPKLGKYVIKNFTHKGTAVNSEGVVKKTKVDPQLLTVARNNIEKAYGDTRWLYAESSDSKGSMKAGKLIPKILTDVKATKELALELDAGSEVKASNWYKNEVDKVIDAVMVEDGKYLPSELNVYVNSKDEKTKGVFVPHNGKLKAGIYISKGKGIRTSSNQKGPMEKFIHELLHSSVYYAIESKDPEAAPLLARLEELRSKVIEEVTWEMLVPKGSTLNVKEEKKNAEMLLDYISGKDGLHEFLALGLSNEGLMKKLMEVNVYSKAKDADTLFGSLVNIAKEFVDTLRRLVRKESKDLTGFELLQTLHKDLLTLNNSTEVEIKTNAISLAIENKIDSANSYLSGVISSIAEKGTKLNTEPPPADNASKKEKAIWLVSNLVGLFTDDRIRPHFENLLNTLGGVVGRDSVFQQLIKTFSNPDELENVVENIGIASTAVDANMHTAKVTVAKYVKQMFEDKLSSRQLSDITSVVLENDLQSLEGYDLGKLLESDDNVDVEIKKLEAKLKTQTKGKTANYYINQARALGKFMATHRAGSSLLLNAENIAKQMNTSYKTDKVDKEIVNSIDMLASLYGLQYTSRDQKDVVAKIVKDYGSGVDAIMALHRQYVMDSRKAQFEGSRVNEIKGYTREIFNRDLDVKIAAIKDKAELERNGYKLKNELPKNLLHNVTGSMGVYISNYGGMREYTKQAVRTLQNSRRGTSFEDLLYDNTTLGAEDVAKSNSKLTKSMAAKVAKDVEKLYKSDNVMIEEDGLVPTYSRKGRAHTFRYIMGKETKEGLLGQDKRASLVLGSMFSGVINHTESLKQNKQVADVMLQDVKENYMSGSNIGKKNFRKYVTIGPKVGDKELREMWYLLPYEMRTQLEEGMRNLNEEQKKAKVFEGVPLREDLLRAYVGQRDATLTNLMGVRLLPSQIKAMIRMAEDMWQEMVKVAKVDIIIRTPAVWIGNILSNMVLSIQLGMTPSEVYHLQTRGFSELRAYKKMEKERSELLLERSRLLYDKKSTKNVDNKIVSLEERMKRSSVYEMIEAGLFSPIAEDVKADDVLAQNKVERFFDGKLQDMPGYIKTGGDWLYLNEKTSAYQFMLKATQYGDFVARYGMYHANLKKTKRKFVEKYGRYPSNKEITEIKSGLLDTVRDHFINYNKIDAKTLKWLNDMGLVMFTKFLLGIQKVISVGLKDKPLNMIIAAAAQSALVDVEDVGEHHFAVANYASKFYSPLSIVDHVVTPTLFETPDLIAKSFSSIRLG